MPDQTKINTKYDNGGDILKEFQLDKLSIEEKSQKEFGLKIAAKIWGFTISGFNGYFYNRNARIIKNRNFANGRIDVQTMFQDRFQFNGKQNYIRLVWQTLQIVNRIVSGLVGRWMERGEKIVVTAMDDLSQKDKEEIYSQLEFVLNHKAELEQLQQASGVQMMPQSEQLPRDKEELFLWKQQYLRTPEEIETELGCNDVLGSNGWNDVLKEMALHDSAEAGLVCTETYMDENGIIYVEKVKPEDSIYSASDYYDFRDWSWLGKCPSIKISELRRRWGKEFNPSNPLALTEEELWSIAQTAKEYKTQTNLVWDMAWNATYMRPYDEWNVRSMHFDIKTVDNEPYTIVKTPFNKTYVRKGEPMDKTDWAKTEKIVDTNINIFHGVYLPDNNKLIEWGLQSNMIRPQDPKEAGNAESRYSFYMYQNYQMRNLAIPEKIEAAVDNMMLACLKMQQVISRMRPTGAAINEDALQEVDFGLGEEGNKAVDKKKLYDQTGDIYYRGRDAEGNPIPIPITELANNGFLGQMQGLIQDYQFWYQTLKDELGEDPNLIQQALQPRVTAENVQTSQQSAQYATDYMYRAYGECMKMTARKISCLLKDSIKYGSEAYRKIIKQDINDRIFTTDIKYLPTAQDVAAFDAMLQNAIASNPELAMFINQFQAMEIAKQDYKLAWVYYNQCLKKMLLWKDATVQQNQQATIQAQISSAQAADQAKQETVKLQGEIDINRAKQVSLGENKTSVVNMVSNLLSKGEPIDPTIQPLVNAVMQNIMIPLAVENEQMRADVIQQMQQAAMAQQQQAQPQQPEQTINQQQPQAAA